jgi:hypothetical protein
MVPDLLRDRSHSGHRVDCPAEASQGEPMLFCPRPKPGQGGTMHTRSAARLIAMSALIGATATVLAPAAMADPQSTLTRAVDSVRSGSRCPPLRSDPFVVRAAQMAMQATSDYISHRTAAVPTGDPMPALKTIGYTGTKAILLSGYGTDEADAIHGLLLEGRESIPNCSYTQYGVSATRDDGGFNLTSVVLAAP